MPIDIHASDTYFIVAHIHYVLFGGSLFTIFAGLYFWFPKMTGRMYNERLGRIHFWLTFIFFNATFFPMHYLGLQGMPRRVYDYAHRFAGLNMFISICSFFLGASTLVFLYNMITSWVRGPRGRGNPWHAHSLEWQVSSPPPIFNFDEIPTVVAGPYEYGVAGAQHALMAEEKGKAESVPRRWRRCTISAAETGAVRATSWWSRTRPSPARACARLSSAARKRGRCASRWSAPSAQPRDGYVVYEDTRRAAARRRLDRTLDAAARRTASPPTASSSTPTRSTRSATRSASSSRNRTRSSSPRIPRSAPAGCGATSSSRSAAVAGDVPVEHVVVDLAREGGQANVLVVANETVVGEPLLAKIRERAAPLPGELSDPLPAERPLRAGPSRCRPPAALALGVLRGDGIDVHGEIAHPDPYTAAMHAVRDERIDEIIVSTFPGERLSSWLRGNLVERLRKDTKVPVEHVEVDPTAALAEAPGDPRLMEAHAADAHAPRPADRERLLADRLARARDAALHRLGDHALRVVLHGLLLRARRATSTRGRRTGSPAGVRGRDQHRHPASPRA